MSAEQYAVLGSPISHSKSPLIHNACFKVLPKNAIYTAHDVNNLGEFLSKHDQLLGVSITMPLKEQAFQLAIRHDGASQRTQSCNTLMRTETGWSGYNTDVFGLRQAAGLHTTSTVAILGTGASARSALVAFENSETAIWGRNEAKSLELAAEFGATSATFEDALQAEFVVSTLPGTTLRELLPTLSTFPGTILDISYVKEQSPHVQFAGGQVSGLEMLIWQALMQQRIFAGRKPSEAFENESKMLEVIMSALNMTK